MKGPSTLAEHDAWLKETGQWDAYVARIKARDEAHKRLVDRLQRAEAPLVEALNAAGYPVKSVWDLVNMKAAYPQALPVLLDNLTRPYPGKIREGIARALAVPEAKFAWSTLTKLYREEQESDAKDGLAVAIAAIAVAHKELVEEVISLTRDTRHGASRLLLLVALERSADLRARAALMELGTDSDLRKEIQAILRRLERKNRKSGR
jgi:ornithine carbamoyltransferase